VLAADRSPSREKLSDADIDRLLAIELHERERLYRESDIWRAHRNRLLCVCLGQGTALHLIDRSGLNDFDVLTFFARSPSLAPRRTRRDVRNSPHTRDATSICSGTPSQRSARPIRLPRYRRGSGRRPHTARSCSPRKRSSSSRLSACRSSGRTNQRGGSYAAIGAALISVDCHLAAPPSDQKPFWLLLESARRGWQEHARWLREHEHELHDYIPATLLEGPSDQASRVNLARRQRAPSPPNARLAPRAR
jgi:hypothetical protein